MPPGAMYVLLFLASITRSVAVHRHQGACPPAGYFMRKQVSTKWLAQKTWYIQQMVATPSHPSRCGIMSYQMLEEPNKFGHVFMSNSYVFNGRNELNFAKEQCFMPARKNDPDSGHFLVSKCEASAARYGIPLAIIAHNVEGKWAVAASKVNGRAGDGKCQPGTEEGSGMWLMSTKYELPWKHVRMIRDHLSLLGYSVQNLNTVRPSTVQLSSILPANITAVS